MASLIRLVVHNYNEVLNNIKGKSIDNRELLRVKFLTKNLFVKKSLYKVLSKYFINNIYRYYWYVFIRVSDTRLQDPFYFSVQK